MNSPRTPFTAPPSVVAQIAGLPDLPMPEIKALWQKLFGDSTPTHNRQFLERRIAYRLQEQAFRQVDSQLLARNQRRIATLIEPGKPLEGLVLDLRSNPGGLLDAAVDVSDLFLDRGVIVSTKGRVAMSSAEFQAQPGDVLKGAPLVVLVDGGSASASEIVAGALQDSRRALILGQRTFGKGSVQSVLPLASGEAIKLTTALYYTPSGRSIQAEGIEPDVLLQAAELRPLGDRERVTEADLPGHLNNGNDAPAEPEPEAAAVPASDPKRDFVLSEALNILRALARWGAR